MHSSLKGQLLVATPGMGDMRFFESVIYLVKHNEEGAMGLVINHALKGLQLNDILEQMNLGKPDDLIKLPASILEQEVFRGGPVEQGRGFVLHSNDYKGRDNSFQVDDNVSLTASIDILMSMAFGVAPKKSFLALGYCGWEAGQLENELKRDGWLITNNNIDLLFNVPTKNRYDKALEQIGVNRASLSSTTGTA